MREEKKYATSSQPPDHIAHLHHQEVFVGPSGVRALPLAAGINVGGHYFGPSEVRALPLAAGINVSGHYWSERRCADGV